MFNLNGLVISGLLATSALAVPVEQQQPRSLLSDKRGLAYNEVSLLNTLLGKAAFSWEYNWAAERNTLSSSGPEFVPMLWGEKMFDEWPDAVEKALSSGSKHIFGFNEPDYPEQANMSPQDAVDAWKTHMNPYADRAKLGSPAVTNSNENGQGLEWLRSFFDACDGDCKVDFLAVHWYASASQFESFKSHVEDSLDLAREQGISDVWVTEFRGEGDGELEFLAKAMSWLDDKDGVAAYAYFKASEFVSGGSITDLGSAYCT